MVEYHTSADLVKEASRIIDSLRDYPLYEIELIGHLLSSGALQNGIKQYLENE